METVYKYALAILVFAITFIIVLMTFGRTTTIGTIFVQMFGDAICGIKINTPLGGGTIPGGGFFGC